MSGELRALGLVHGLLLGLLLASPLIAPSLMPWGVEALFILGGFQLRLADRRWAMRNGWSNWISHIRMAPARLIPWAAAGLSRRSAGAVLVLLVMLGLGAAGEAIRYMIGFMTGISACLFWLRGPDGEAHALGLALTGLVAAAVTAVLLPAAMPVALPAAIVCATLALAHISTLRRRPISWRVGGGLRVRP